MSGIMPNNLKCKGKTLPGDGGERGDGPGTSLILLTFRVFRALRVKK